MPTDQHFPQAHSLPSPQEELGEWAWFNTTTPAMPLQDPVYHQDLDSFTALHLDLYAAELADPSWALQPLDDIPLMDPSANIASMDAFTHPASMDALACPLGADFFSGLD